jgi:predicted  nucleic acid-binding Zn-ribbon protein
MPADFAKRRAQLPTMTAALLLAVGLAGPLGGCSNDDPAARALEDAGRLMRTITGNGVQMVPDAASRAKQLQEVLTTLQPFASGNTSQAAAASLITAQARTGLADLDALAATEAEREALGQARAIRGHFETWLRQNARAAAREGFDPQAQLDAIAKEAEQVRGQTETQKRALADAEKALADLQARREQLLEQAKALRAQATALREQAGQGSAVAGLPVLEQAVALQRQADGLEVQASDLGSQAAGVRPVVDQARRDLDRLARQAESLKVAGSGIQQRVELSRKQAGEARVLAAQAGEQIAAATKALSEFRAGPLAETSEKAIKGYRDAAGAARRGAAAGADASAAKSASAAATLAAGDALFVRARGIEDHLALLRALAAAQPKLPNHDALTAEIATLEPQFKTVLDEARTAYTEARDGFEGGGARGEEAQARIANLVSTLNAVLEGKGRLSAPPPPPPGEPAADGSGQAAAPAGDGAVERVTAMLREADAAMKAGDTAALAAFYRLETPEQQGFFDASAAMSAAQNALNAASTEKLGKSLTEIAATNPMLAGLLSPGLDPSTFDITPGENGQVRIAVKGAPMPIAWTASERDGQWKFDGIIPQGMPMPPQMMIGMAKALTGVLDTLAADVRSGTIASPEQLGEQLMQRAGAAMQQAMGGGGTGG